MPRRVGFVLAIALAAVSCGDEMPEERAVTAPAVAAAPADPNACTIPSGCPDLSVETLQSKACCTPKTACGYILPELDEETRMLFPDAEGFIANLAKDDPNGRCVPEWIFFGPRPGLDPHRFEPEQGPDILITPDCDSYTLAAFILPGCCLPNNTCGLSTDESYPTLEYLGGFSGAPFEKPECVSAEELNQQFRDSGKLASFARTVASGTCDYAALDAMLPSWWD